MPLQKFNCVKCEKQFEVGQWTCVDGADHEVAPKTYYVDNPSSDIKDAKKSRLMVYTTPEREVTDPTTGQREIKMARAVEFVRGTLTTSNAQDQMFLDRYPGRVNKQRWEEVYITPAERVYLKEQEVKKREEVVREKENALLDKVRGEKGAAQAQKGA
jgi:hypothetical protein